MGFTTVWKNFGHAIAVAAKYTVVGIKDVVLVANKSQAVAPEVDLLVGAIAGPAAAKVSDLAFHALGDLANALEPVGNDITAEEAAKGLNVPLDIQFVNDLKAILPVLKGILNSTGAAIPPAGK